MVELRKAHTHTFKEETKIRFKFIKDDKSIPRIQCYFCENKKDLNQSIRLLNIPTPMSETSLARICSDCVEKYKEFAE